VRQYAAVRAGVCGSDAHGSVGAMHAAVCDNAVGSVLYGSARDSVQLCVSAVVCGSVRQCVAVFGSAQLCAAVCGSAI
jgi:hypothetical protein